MQEILFRGKDIRTKEWVYGWYTRYSFGRWPIRHCIIPSEAAYYEHVDAIPEIIEQFTGLRDSKGTKIFVGDIISAISEECEEEYRFEVKFGECGGVKNVPHDVGFIGFYFDEIGRFQNTTIRKDPIYFLNEYKCEVIGNIHDNPELKEKK